MNTRRTDIPRLEVAKLLLVKFVICLTDLHQIDHKFKTVIKKHDDENAIYDE